MDLFFVILLSAAIIVFGFGAVYAISYVLRRYGYFTHGAQFFISIMSFIVILSFTYVAFGEDTVSYLMNGLFIGVGLSLQPLMKTITKGFVFDGTHILNKEIEILGKDVRGTVHTVGMMHTWVVDKCGQYYMISNDTINQEIIKVCVSKEEIQPLLGVKNTKPYPRTNVGYREVLNPVKQKNQVAKRLTRF
jgi:hypothetical protein